MEKLNINRAKNLSPNQEISSMSEGLNELELLKKLDYKSSYQYNDTSWTEEFLKKQKQGKYLEKIVYPESSLEDRELYDKIVAIVKPYIEKKIDNETLHLSNMDDYGSFDYLEFEDEEFLGRFIFPTEDGLVATVYQKKYDKPNESRFFGGDAMKTVFINLDKEHKDKLIKSLKSDLEHAEQLKTTDSFDDHDLDALRESYDILSPEPFKK